MAKDVKGVCPGCGHCTVCGEKRESEVERKFRKGREAAEALRDPNAVLWTALGFGEPPRGTPTPRTQRKEEFLFNLGTYVNRQLEGDFHVEFLESPATGDTYIVATRRRDLHGGAIPWENRHGHSFCVPREWVRDRKYQVALNAVTAWFGAIRTMEGL